MNENKKKMYDLSGPKTVEAMKKRHFDAYYCSTAAEAVEKALELLSGNSSVMDKIAEYLIEKETITGKEFMKIFREMKGIPEEESDKKDSLMPETEGAKQDEAKAPEQTIAPATDDMFEE